MNTPSDLQEFEAFISSLPITTDYGDIYDDGTKALTSSQVQEVLAKVRGLVEAAEKKSYLRGYNSGWVKATRVTRPQHLDYYADQLELAVKTLRNASARLQAKEGGERSE